MTDDTQKTRYALAGNELYRNALRAQLLARRRPTFEHDVKNLLHSLLSGTELLAKSLQSTSRHVTPEDCLALLRQQLARAQTTLTCIVEETAPQFTEPQDFDVSVLLQECAHALRHELQNVNLATALAPDVLIRAQRANLKDLLLTLMLECVDRAQPRSALRIAVAAADSDGRAHIVIEFTPTQDILTSPLLPILRELLELENAKVTIGGDTSGTRVDVDAPRIERPAHAGADAIRVVIVDAHRDAADSLALLAQLEGLTASAAHDVEQAMNAVRADCPHAVIVDLDGSLDCRELVSRIRNECRPVPRLIGMSQGSMRGMTIDLPVSFDTYLDKPLNVTALRELLTNACKSDE